MLQLWPAIQPVAASGRGGLLPLRWPDKAAAEVLNFGFDATALLASAVDTLVANIAAPGQQLIAQVVTGGIVVIWLGGGTPGTDNEVDLRLAAASGAFVRRIVRILTL